MSGARSIHELDGGCRQELSQRISKMGVQTAVVEIQFLLRPYEIVTGMLDRRATSEW